MTPQEAILIRDARPDLSLKWYQHPDRRFVLLRGRPCPLLRMDAGVATCTVHAARPYSCRRFKCYRPDPSTEPYEPEPLDLERGRLGCANLSDRLAQSRAVRRDYALNQRKAQRWALAHGWAPDQVPQGSASRVPYHQFVARSSSAGAGVLACGTVNITKLHWLGSYSRDSHHDDHDDGAPSASESCRGNTDTPMARSDTTPSPDDAHAAAMPQPPCSADSQRRKDTPT